MTDPAKPVQPAAACESKIEKSEAQATLTRTDATQTSQPAKRSFANIYKDNAQGIEIERLKMRIEELEAQPVPPPTTRLDDPKAQVVYDILCADDAPPEGEHWEGFTARRIVDALAQPVPPADQPVPWHHRILTAHPRSEPEHWPDALRVKYMAEELAEHRAALAQPVALPVHRDFRVTESVVSQPAAQPVVASVLNNLAKRRIFDAIRAAYDLGYSDARNSRAVCGDSAPGYRGRDVEADHGGALLTILNNTIAQPVPPADQETVAWAVYAEVNGILTLQYPIEGSLAAAQRHVNMYEPALLTEIRPLTHPAPSQPAALPGPTYDVDAAMVWIRGATTQVIWGATTVAIEAALLAAAGSKTP